MAKTRSPLTVLSVEPVSGQTGPAPHGATTDIDFQQKSSATPCGSIIASVSASEMLKTSWRSAAPRFLMKPSASGASAVEEAGGSIVDRKSNPLGALTGLEQRTSLIAAASSELAKEIASVLAPSDY